MVNMKRDPLIAFSYFFYILYILLLPPARCFRNSSTLFWRCSSSSLETRSSGFSSLKTRNEDPTKRTIARRDTASTVNLLFDYIYIYMPVYIIYIYIYKFSKWGGALIFFDEQVVFIYLIYPSFFVERATVDSGKMQQFMFTIKTEKTCLID